MRLTIIIIALLAACSPRQVLVPVPTPPLVEVRYLPATVTQIVDSTHVDTSTTVDSLTGVISRLISKERYKSTVTEKGRIDSIPYPVPYAVIDTFRTPKEYVHPAPWKWWGVGIIGAIVGAAIAYVGARVFRW